MYLSMKIPNEEILYVYENTIMEWFNDRIEAADFSGLYEAVINGDTETFESCLRKHLRESISFLDSAENFLSWFPFRASGGDGWV